MKRFVVVLLLAASTMLGCAQNHFNVPAENYAEKVKVLGIAPFFVDADSDITHPEKELLVPLISDLNKKYEPLLVRKLQGTGNYYAVTQLADDPRPLYNSLIARREKRDDAGIQYNKYFWKNDEVGAYIKKNRLDAMMVVVVSGLTKNSKIFSSNLLASLETNFNFLTMTAQILGPDGTVLWEYPNFRGQLLTYYPLVNLQYPDFSESEANYSNKTAVRFKSLDGIRRTLERKKSDILFRETDEPEVYGKLFDEMTSLVSHSVERKKTGIEVSEEGKQPPAMNEPSKQNDTSAAPARTELAPPPAPAATPPAEAPTPQPAAEATDSPTTTPSEAAPAPESPR